MFFIGDEKMISLDDIKKLCRSGSWDYVVINPASK